MAYIPAVNTAELVLFGSLAGQQIVSVHHFLYPAAIDASDLNTLATLSLAAWLDDLQAEVSTEYQLTSIKATDLTTFSSPTVTIFPATTTLGGVAQPSIANNAALVISQGTASRGRSFRGRTYHAGIPQTFLDDSARMVEANRLGAQVGWFNFWDDIATSTSSTHVVCSKYTGGAARASAVLTPITTINANIDLDSQRRRLAGRGA